MAQQRSQTGAFHPSVQLSPLNDSFTPKRLVFRPQEAPIRIGRQINAETLPSENNGYFSSKALDIHHAEIFADVGKVYIKDMGSANGTFINGERLSQKAVESESFELRTDDIVEFGIDLVDENFEGTIDSKVAAKVLVFLAPEDAASLPTQAE